MRSAQFKKKIQWRWKLKVGRIFGIDIYLDFSWFFALIFFGFVFQRIFVQALPGISLALSWALGILAVLVLFASVLFHELSHSLVAKRYKLPIPRITLLLFGGIAHSEKEPESPGAEFKITIAGPLSSFFLAGLFFSLFRLVSNYPLHFIGLEHFLCLKQFLEVMLWVNLMLGIFNLLPGFPMDGGRLLRAILWKTTRSFSKATKWAAGVGQFFGALVFVFGVLNIFVFKSFGGFWLVFIGLLIILGARASYKQASKTNPN